MSHEFQVGKEIIRPCRFEQWYGGYLKNGPQGSNNKARMGRMAITTAIGFQGVRPAPAVSTTGRRPLHRRISPQAGRALEILGHAIEYLTDEYVHAGGAFDAQQALLEAVQLLMARNREIYFECSEVQTLSERCRAWLHRRAA